MNYFYYDKRMRKCSADKFLFRLAECISLYVKEISIVMAN
ncbi:hypothetical protein [Caulobacter phage Cr30]|nr:hypothetical protein OZ74_gp096 [Caulobacter phage Cr30]AGS80981.1 hypothetical protein [Caulobacter phage Cr30]